MFNVDNMYVVGNLGSGWTTNVELFSETVGGKPQVVYVYPGASAAERTAAETKGIELGIPIQGEVQMKTVTIHTNSTAVRGVSASCAVALTYVDGNDKTHTKQLVGIVAGPTGNRGKLAAAILGLESLKTPCSVRLFTDSLYLRQGAKFGLAKWATNDWKTTKGTKVRNRDLWDRILELAETHEVSWLKPEADTDIEICATVKKLAAADAGIVYAIGGWVKSNLEVPQPVSEPGLGEDVKRHEPAGVNQLEMALAYRS